MIGWGAHFQVSGLSDQVPSPGDQVQVRVQEICPLSSVIDSAIDSFRVAGGSPGWPVAGLFHAALHAVLNAVLHAALHSALHSVLRDRFSHLSSIQPSIHSGWQVAAPGGRWRGFSTQPSIQPSTQSSIQSSVIPSAQPEAARSARSADPTSRQCPEITKNDELRTKNSLEQPYVVTRSLPLALPLWACK